MKLVSYNVNQRAQYPECITVIIELLRGFQADVISLQE
jgi:exonuclease III